MLLVNLGRRLDRQDRYLRKAPKKRNYKKLLIRLLVLFVILFVFIYIPVRGVYSSGKQILNSARAMNESFKNQNLDQIRQNIADIKSADASLNLYLNMLIWVRIIPFVGDYYADARHFAKASQYEVQAAQTIFDSLEPHKSELGFNGTPAPGQDRVAQMVKILNKVLPQLDTVSPLLKKASDEVSSVDVDKYPEMMGQRRVRSQVETAKNFITGAYIAVTDARPALEQAPQALGEPSAKTYLLLFQNDKEIRATGGFMTAYATLKLDHGRMSSSQSDDIYRLDEKLLNVCLTKICPLSPPDPIVKYLPEANGKPRTAWSMRDSNLSPDLSTSMRQFEKMYSFLGEGNPWDGIIMIDTHVLEEMIKLTGPIEVFGTTFSADNDKRCNCPNVIYELENNVQILEKGEKDRKAVLGTLMQQLLARSLGSSTDKMPEFINAGVKLANAKHIMFYMHDEKLERALEKLGWTGQIKQTDGDYLTINDSNFAGGKSNLYVVQNVILNIKPENGKTVNKLTIDYKNPEKYGTWLNGINRDYVRIYVPKGAKLISSKGSEVKVTTIEEELNKTVFEAFIQVRPGNSTQLMFEYELPQNFTKDGKYPLLIQKQPGTKDFEYNIQVNGSTKEKFKLDNDKELKLSI